MEEATSSGEFLYYIIGPGDSVDVFVWGKPELSTSVQVRPDGNITVPLVEDLKASGKTSSQLARDLESNLSKYVKNPIVTVTITQFVGRYSEQIRVVGAAAEPKMLPYTEDMTLLDVMIEVGGLTEFAAGNRASIVRVVTGEQKQFRVYLDDLINDGDISKNVDMYPGDVLIIPQSWF
jgi:polysaccharide export outer membrane protein